MRPPFDIGWVGFAIFRSEFGNSESKFSYVVDEWQNSQIP